MTNRLPIDKRIEIKKLISDGFTREEISQLLGIPEGTISHYQNKQHGVKEVRLSEQPETHIVENNHSLDAFVNNLSELLSEYKTLKNEREGYKRQMLAWQKQAGKLNADIQSLIQRQPGR